MSRGEGPGVTSLGRFDSAPPSPDAITWNLTPKIQLRAGVSRMVSEAVPGPQKPAGGPQQGWPSSGGVCGPALPENFMGYSSFYSVL